MLHKLLEDPRFWSLLSRLDDDLGDEARRGGCIFCHAKLHSADYPRKPRGGPADLSDAEYGKRCSFCCARCRRRVTPPSVRFLGRKVYLGAVVVLATTLRYGPTPHRGERLHELFGVSGRTLARWREWWRESVGRSSFWRAAAGAFSSPVPTEQLPWSLLERFGGEAGDRLVELLRFVSPITTRSARNAMPV